MADRDSGNARGLCVRWTKKMALSRSRLKTIRTDSVGGC